MNSEAGAGAVMLEPVAPAAPAANHDDLKAWRVLLEPYERPSVPRGLLDLATSVVPYVALMVAMFLARSVSVPLTVALGILAVGFLVRTFVVFHDCAHNSLLPSKRANMWLGRPLGVLVFTPYAKWRHDHVLHHATSGDLDRRGVGDVPTKTVAEYRALAWRGRLLYRTFRNPAVMLGLGALIGMIILPRFVNGKDRPRLRRSVLFTDAALCVMIGVLCWAVGWQAYLIVQGPVALCAGAAGVWLFYVQHQFDGTYWRDGDHWDYADAALRGSSYLRLPGVLRFFSGNVGLHHVHHLSARIPNYNLQRAHDEIPAFHEVQVTTAWQGLRALRLKLWDEDRGRLVTFAEANAH